MPCRIIKTAIALLIFLFSNLFYLSAQEKQEAREEAIQRYLQEQESSLGAKQEAPTGFEKATPIVTPSVIEFTQKVQREQEKALAPSGVQGQTSQKATPIVTPSAIEFAQKVQREQEKALAPAPKSAKESLPSKEKKKKKKKKITEEEKEEQETEPIEAAVAPQPAPEAEEPEVREYYIDIGDVLDISVWELPLSQEKLAEQKTKEKKDAEYYIDIGDVLDISVWQVQDLSRPDVIVRPDGKISFPLIGDIKADGLSLTQLDSLVTEKLKEYVKSPEVSIMIRSFGRSPGGGLGKTDNLIHRSELSLSDVIIRPDGKISFPLIGDIKAEGLTLTQLDDLITEKLKAQIKNPDVTVMLRRFGEQANKVIILGEIPSPGVYKFTAGPPTITEVLASAGGYTRYAVLNSIMVIRGDIRTKPEVIRVNFAKILKIGRLSENIFLKPNDIVYVPRSFIGNVNTFLELIQPAISEYVQTMNVRYLQRTLHRN